MLTASACVGTLYLHVAACTVVSGFSIVAFGLPQFDRLRCWEMPQRPRTTENIMTPLPIKHDSEQQEQLRSAVNRQLTGFDYRSRLHIFGLPLVHICRGGLEVPGVAKGIIAIGDIAVGFIAVGGLAVGFFTVGAVGFGVITVAGLAVSLLAVAAVGIGGCVVAACGLGYWVWGLVAIGVHAHGAIAIGYLAVHGMLTVSPNGINPTQ